MGLFDDLQKTPELPEENELLQPRGESLETPDVAPETTEEAILVANNTRKNIEQEEGMKFGTPVDFAEQFNNTLLAAIAAPFDVTEWAVNRAAAVVFPDKFSYNKDDLIDGEYRPWLSGSWGTSKNIETHVKPYIGTTEKADTYLGYAGNTFGEGAAFLAGGAGVVQKTKQAGGVVGAISRQADDALRNKLGTVVAAEGVAAAGMAGGRQYAEENEMGPVASFLLEFSTGALALVSGAAAKKTVLDPLTAKLKNMTATEALEKLSKEEVAEVVARGREEKAKVEPEAEAPATPKDTPNEAIPSKVDYSDAKVGDTIEIVGVDGKRSQVEVIGISEQSGTIKFKRKDGSEGLVGMSSDSVRNDINSPDYELQAAGHGTKNKNIKDLSDAELDDLEALLKRKIKETPTLRQRDGDLSALDHQSDLFAIQLERKRRTGKPKEAPAEPTPAPKL